VIGCSPIGLEVNGCFRRILSILASTLRVFGSSTSAVGACSATANKVARNLVAAGLRDVVAGKFRLIRVALVLHVLLDADLRRVIRVHDSRLELLEELLLRLLRLRFVLCHARENR